MRAVVTWAIGKRTVSAQADVKVVTWEETEEPPSLSYPLPSCHTGENGVKPQAVSPIPRASAPWLGWFEKFEIELKRYATPVEVVSDNETFRFGPAAVKKSSRAVIFLVAVGQKRAPLESKPSGRGRLLIDQCERGEGIGKCD